MIKKIAVFTTVHPFYDNRIYFKQIGSLLEEYDVDYFVTKHNIIKANLDLESKKGKLEFIYLKEPSNRFFRILNGYSLIPKLIKSQADIYLFHDFELIPIGIILKILRKKIIFDMHEDYISVADVSVWIPVPLRSIIKNLCKTGLFFGKLFMDFIILAEDGYKEYFQNHRKCDVIHNFPQINIKLDDYVVKENNSIVYLGSISANRGLWRMLALTKQLIEEDTLVKLHLIGRFEEKKLRKEFDKYLIENSLENNVIYYGVIPNKDVYSMINKFSVGLILLDYEKNFFR